MFGKCTNELIVQKSNRWSLYKHGYSIRNIVCSRWVVCEIRARRRFAFINIYSGLNTFDDRRSGPAAASDALDKTKVPPGEWRPIRRSANNPTSRGGLRLPSLRTQRRTKLSGFSARKFDYVGTKRTVSGSRMTLRRRWRGRTDRNLTRCTYSRPFEIRVPKFKNNFTPAERCTRRTAAKCVSLEFHG